MSASWGRLSFVLNYRDQAWVEKLPWCLVASIPMTIPSRKIYVTIALLEVRHLHSCVPGSVEHLAQYGSIGRAMDTTRAECPAPQSCQPAAVAFPVERSQTSQIWSLLILTGHLSQLAGLFL